MKHRKVFPTVFAVLAILLPGPAVAGEAVDARIPDIDTKLERIEPDPMMLEVPASLAQETKHFSVAKQAPVIEFGLLPNPRNWQKAKGTTWSSWGDSCLGPDGRFYASYGDHRSPHGSAYVCSIDPVSKDIKLIVDHNKVVNVPDGKYTPGKIHCPLVDGGDGWLYFFGYHGDQGGTTGQFGYKGNWLLRYNLQTGMTENLGIPVADSCVPVLASSPKLQRLYGYAVPGVTMFPPVGRFFVYDTARNEMVFQGGPKGANQRALIVTEDGRAFYDSISEDGTKKVFAKYDPKTNDVTLTNIEIPDDGQLRAATPENPDGIVVCFSNKGRMIYFFDTRNEKMTGTTYKLFPFEEKSRMGWAMYTASATLDPTGRYVYYVPGAHNSSMEIGSAIIQLDIKTQKRKVIAFLAKPLILKQGFRPTGTFATAISRDGSQLFVNWNGDLIVGGDIGRQLAAQPGINYRLIHGKVQKGVGWGHCAAMILHIPQAER